MIIYIKFFYISPSPFSNDVFCQRPGLGFSERGKGRLGNIGRYTQKAGHALGAINSLVAHCRPAGFAHWAPGFAKGSFGYLSGDMGMYLMGGI